MSGGSNQDDSKKKPEKEKDFTGILELSALMPPKSAEELLEQDPFAVNEMKPVEQIDQFESIDQIGMMDHVPEPEPAKSTVENEDPFAVSVQSEPDPNAMDFSADSPRVAFENASSENFENSNSPSSGFAPSDLIPNETTHEVNIDIHLDAPVSSEHTSPRVASEGGFTYVNPDATQSTTHQDPFADHPPKTTSSSSTSKIPTGIDGIKNYSERARETSFQSNLKSPFHLWIAGSFDPFARDKLLLFITENPMGLNSSELDRQINAGRVLLPRISEFAGIKMIQDLRDSGLSFKLSPSSRDEDDVLPQAENLRLQYQSTASTESGVSILVLPAGAIDEKIWQVFESIQIAQFLKAEMVEVERSELFQELLERMTASLKSKARLKGAAAIGSLVHHLKPLRLPSHYQLELKADLLKKL